MESTTTTLVNQITAFMKPNGNWELVEIIPKEDGAFFNLVFVANGVDEETNKVVEGVDIIQTFFMIPNIVIDKTTYFEGAYETYRIFHGVNLPSQRFLTQFKIRDGNFIGDW